MEAAFWLAVGCIAAFVFVVVARQQKENDIHVLAYGLVVAGLIYAGFGFTSGSVSWMSIEGGGVILYGTFAWLGIRHHPVWVGIGWLLHPIWDVGLHLYGEGAAFVPYWYAMLCLSFDLVVAGYIGYAIYLRRVRVPQHT